MRWKDVFGLALCVSAVAEARGQATYTASRAGDLQVGGDVAYAVSQYLPVDVGSGSAPLSDLSRQVHLLGGGAYATFDVRHHVGMEVDFLRLNSRDDANSQTSGEFAGRYILFRGYHFVPYARAGIGHGWYVYPQGAGTVGYNLYSLGGGVDYHVLGALNVRAAYEYQSWLNVPIRNPQPQVVSVGFAYRFH